MFFEEEDFFSSNITEKNNIIILPSSDENLRKNFDEFCQVKKPFRNSIKKKMD